MTRKQLLYIFNYPSTYTLQKGVINMVVKINNKPIQVRQEEDSEFSWTYLCVSTFGYGLVLYMMDFVARIFIGTSPMPWLHNTVGFIIHVINYIGAWVSWLF